MADLSLSTAHDTTKPKNKQKNQWLNGDVKRIIKIEIQTKTHSTETSQNNQQNNPKKVTMSCQFKDGKTKHQHKCRLETHHGKLTNDMREKNLNCSNTRHQTSLKYSLIPFNQHGTRC